MDSREFPIGAVLTVAFGRLLPPFDQWHEILEWMTQSSLFNHQLSRVNDLCRPYLLKQYPVLNPEDHRLQLARLVQYIEIDHSVIEKQKWFAEWIEGIRMNVGLPRVLDVAPLPEGVYRPTNPLADLAEMIGPERVIVVAKDGAE